MYSLAYALEFVFSRSANMRSMDRSRRALARSNSGAVNPNCSTRVASVRRASRPGGIAPSFTAAPIWKNSLAPMNRPCPTPAPRKGGSAFCDSSNRRAFSIAENRSSTSPWRYAP
jgi:hypothetical protein